jgi:anti-anti-sigma factor
MSVADCAPATIGRRGLFAPAGGDRDRTIVWLRGEHDMFTVAALGEILAAAIALDDADVVLDLSAVEFIDAGTIGAIVRAQEALRLRSRSLAVRAPSGCAHRILDLCGFAGLIDAPPAAATPTAGRSDALATWVAVPTTSPADRTAHQPPSEPAQVLWTTLPAPGAVMDAQEASPESEAKPLARRRP